MKKTNEDTITMEEYNRYPYWFEVTSLGMAITSGEIHHIELVNTSHNTTGHRLYKITTNIGNIYTVKVETTFKAAPLEHFINAIINGMSVKYEKDRILSFETESHTKSWIPSAERKARDDLRFEAYRKGYRDGQIDTFHTLAQGEEVLNKLKGDKE